MLFICTLLNPLNYATEAKICHDGNSSNMLKSFSKPTFKIGFLLHIIDPVLEHLHPYMLVSVY